MGSLDDFQPQAIEVELDALFAAHVPHTVDEFREAQQWYALRKQRLDWLRLKRSQARSKRSEQLERLRANRTQMLRNLQGVEAASNGLDPRRRI